MWYFLGIFNVLLKLLSGSYVYHDSNLDGGAEFYFRGIVNIGGIVF